MDPEQGFAAIYAEYGARLYAYCHRMLRSPSDAADAVQECFVTALAKIDQLRDPSKLRSWLYAIARNHCMRLFGHRAREVADDTVAEELQAPEIDAAPASRELVELVWAASDGLSEIDRQVLELNLRHELDGEELAQSLGVEPARCYVMLHRAKERLQSSVGALLVARTGRDDCAELASVVGSTTTDSFTPLIRKRVNRHVKGCATCTDTQNRHRPEAYLAVVPLLRPPDAVRDQVARAVREAARRAAASAGAGAASTAVAGAHRDWGWQPDGFPIAAANTAKRGALLIGTATLLLLLAGVAVVGLNRLGSNEVAVSVVPSEPTEIPATGPVFEPTSSPAEDSDEPPLVVTATPEPSEPPTSTPVPATMTPTPTAEPEAEPQPPVAPPPEPPTPTPEPPTSTPEPPTPTPEPPTPTPTPTATPEPPTPTPTPTLIPDLNPPTVSDAIASCQNDSYTVTVTVADDVSPMPIVSLTMTFNDESAPGRPMIATSPNSLTYQASVANAESPGGATFYVRGGVSDEAGNIQLVNDTASCAIIE